jgi:hypothetical protein
VPPREDLAMGIPRRVLVTALLVGAVVTSTPLAGSAATTSCTNEERFLRSGAELPDAVRVFDEGTGLVGSGAIWTRPGTGATNAVYDPLDDEWRLKQPWFRTKPGAPRLSAQHLDGRGTARIEVATGDEYPGVGFITSRLLLAEGGCWRVTARFRGSVARVVVEVPRGVEGICAELVRQDAVRNDYPANRGYYAALDADLTRLGCTTRAPDS